MEWKDHMSIISKFRLDNKVAVVTGSSRGIGREIAIAFAEQGADIVLNCRSQRSQADAVAEEIRALGRKVLVNQADLVNPEDVRRLYQEAMDAFGKIDILVLNASYQIRKEWSRYSLDEVEQQMMVNFTASYELIRLVVPQMKEREWGRVLTIGSIQEIKPHPDMLIYAASKCAQASMVKNLARQITANGVTINNLAPGTIITDRTKHVLEDPTYREQVLADIPINDFGRSEDCASAALLLCSDAGRFINGIDLLVNGGAHL